jgi:sugar phosphate permease
MPLPLVGLLLALVGAGMGTVLPVTTVAIQNAVPMHQLGTATGAMNFFRSLGGAIAVAGFGAILLRGVPLHAGADLFHGADVDAAALARVFHELFLAATAGFVVSLICLLMMEERPLRSGKPQATAPEAAH